jgi:ankyrin repeat protein
MAGADVSAPDRYRPTLLHFVAGAASEDVASTLLDAGAKLNPQDERGRSPLFHARDAGMQELLLRLYNAKGYGM